MLVKKLSKTERTKRMAPRALLAACREPQYAFAAHLVGTLYNGTVSYTATENDAGAALRLLEKHGLLTSVRTTNPKPSKPGRVRLYTPTKLGLRVAQHAWVLVFLDDFFRP